MKYSARMLGVSSIVAAIVLGLPSIASSTEETPRGEQAAIDEETRNKESSVGQVDFRRGVTHSAQIHEKLPEYRFLLSADSKHNTVRRVDVMRGGDNTVIQSLAPSPDAAQPFFTDEKYFVVEDVKFDGYKDVRLLSGYGGTGNRYFRFWLFDPASGLFTFNQAMDEMCNPTVDPIAKTIKSHYNGGAAGCIFTDSIYQVDSNGKCIETRRVVQDLDSDRKCFLTTTFEWRDGALRQVSVEASISCGCL